MNDSFNADLSRRGLLRSLVGGSVLLPGIVSQLLAEDAAATALPADPLAPKPMHFPPRAKRVIFLFMSGGVSNVDTWDPKPKLVADAGKTIPVNEFQGRKGDFNMFLKRPQWEFAPHGKWYEERRDHGLQSGDGKVAAEPGTKRLCGDHRAITGLAPWARERSWRDPSWGPALPLGGGRIFLPHG